MYRYTVKPGDTLSGIAAYYDVSPEAILAANHNLSEDNIVEGMEIVIPITTGESILRRLLGR